VPAPAPRSYHPRGSRPAPSPRCEKPPSWHLQQGRMQLRVRSWMKAGASSTSRARSAPRALPGQTSPSRRHRAGILAPGWLGWSCLTWLLGDPQPQSLAGHRRLWTSPTQTQPHEGPVPAPALATMRTPRPSRLGIPRATQTPRGSASHPPPPGAQPQPSPPDLKAPDQSPKPRGMVMAHVGISCSAHHRPRGPAAHLPLSRTDFW